ncbi:MAG: transglycosylase SLT domain-containing protein [Patescibacteria group bacterium]
MELIKQDQLDKTIEQDFDYNFEVKEKGLYLIEIIASCKSWKQNLIKFISFFKDDDLTVKIDEIEFPKSDGREGLFDGEVAWNGNNLKRLLKTNLFVIYLDKGKHNIQFLIEQKPFLQSIKISKTDQLKMEPFIPMENNPAQDGNRRQWMNIVLVNLSLKNLFIKASANKRGKDADDIKLIIDNEIQKNPDSSWWGKNWYWQGRKLKGQDKEFNKQFNFPKGLHYIELWADRTPRLRKVEIEVGEIEVKDKKLAGKIVLYQDVEKADFVNIRSTPERPEHKGLGDNKIFQLKNGEKVEVLEKEVEGEYIQNKSDIWHKIKYQNKEGYVLSSFVEIQEQDRTRVMDKIKNQAKLEKINEDFAVALAGCESHYKPYAVSTTGACGIYQLTSIAREDLKERFNFEIAKEEIFNVDKNIEAGIIYLKWLFDVYSNAQDKYKKIIAAWNAGQSLIPVEGKISYEKIKDQEKIKEVKKLIECVETNQKEKNWKYIISFIFLGFIFLGSLVYSNIWDSIRQTNNKGEVLGINTDVIYEQHFKFYNPYPGIDSILVTSASQEPFDWQTNIIIEFENKVIEKQYSGFLENAYLFNPNFSEYPELFLVRRQGKQVLTSILYYNNKKNILESVKFIDKDGIKSSNLCCSYVIYKPRPNGVQYDIAIRMPDYNDSQYLGEYEIVYKYDFLKDVFYEQSKTYLANIPGG